MALISDYEVDFEEFNYKVGYNFYLEYINHNHFREKFEQRLEHIKDKYVLNMDNELLLQNYFVEVFSWSVIPREVLLEIAEFLKKNEINVVIDPCCGTGFHTFLFDTFTRFSPLCCDNQPEPYSWLTVQEGDGEKLLDDLNDKEHEEGALILSWIDGDILARNLLAKFAGEVVISIGNYEGLSPGYLYDLRYNYECKKRFILEMPWGLKEIIELYVRL
tara:strand:- start:15 stop:668 length:654 start_codon:yes stop_codon:yes gene_type:complete